MVTVGFKVLMSVVLGSDPGLLAVSL